MSNVVERTSEDGLSLSTYRFTIFDGTILVLDEYKKVTRPSKKHKFRFDERGVPFYSRLRERDSNLKEEDVVILDDVKAEAMNNIISKVRVVSWAEHKARLGHTPI